MSGQLRADSYISFTGKLSGYNAIMAIADVDNNLRSRRLMRFNNHLPYGAVQFGADAFFCGA